MWSTVALSSGKSGSPRLVFVFVNIDITVFWCHLNLQKQQLRCKIFLLGLSMDIGKCYFDTAGAAPTHLNPFSPIILLDLVTILSR